MNYHSDNWINEKVHDHYMEAKEYFHDDSIVGIFLQGSQNYGLDYEGSDVDTKLIVVPTFKDIAMNKKPVSTTHVRSNNEHIDWKDVRLYIQTFRKQNLKFVEILFTPYKIINPKYSYQWNRLTNAREEIARYAPNQAIKVMGGVSRERYHAMEHRYPSRIEWIDRFGYDPKQLHHLIRMEQFIERYIQGHPYEHCLKDYDSEYMVKVKQGYYSLEEARKVADDAINNIEAMCDKFLSVEHPVNEKIDDLLNDVQYEIMKLSVIDELSESGLSCSTM